MALARICAGVRSNAHSYRERRTRSGQSTSPKGFSAPHRFLVPVDAVYPEHTPGQIFADANRPRFADRP